MSSLLLYQVSAIPMQFSPNHVTLLTAPFLFSSLLGSASLNVILRRLLSGICGFTYKVEAGAAFCVFFVISSSKEKMRERKKDRERERAELYIVLGEILCYWSQIIASTTFLRDPLSRTVGSQRWQVLPLLSSIPSTYIGMTKEAACGGIEHFEILYPHLSAAHRYDEWD